MGHPPDTFLNAARAVVHSERPLRARLNRQGLPYEVLPELSRLGGRRSGGEANVLEKENNP